MAEVGANAEAVFVMVMTGDQAKAVILGNWLDSTPRPGSVILLSATIKASEARDIGAGVAAATAISKPASVGASADSRNTSIEPAALS